MIDIDKKLQQFLSTNDENEILEYKEAKNEYDFDNLGGEYIIVRIEEKFKNQMFEV